MPLSKILRLSIMVIEMQVTNALQKWYIMVLLESRKKI